MDSYTIAPNEIAKVYYKIDTKAATNWGNVNYDAQVKCNGVVQKTKLYILIF